MAALQDAIDAQLKTLIEDNLVIPGLVGPNCAYKNMRSYLTQNHTTVTFQLNEMAQRLNNMDMAIKRESQELTTSFKADVAKLNVERFALAATLRQEISSLGTTQEASLKKEQAKGEDEQRKLLLRIEQL